MKKVTLLVSKLAIACGTVTGLMAVSAAALAEEVAEPGLTHDCGNSPRGTALPVVLKAINEVSGPHSTILVAAYEFTSQPIARALIEAKQRGATVAVVADPTENVIGKHSAYSKIHELTAAGIPVRVDNRLDMVHDKFMVLSGTAVETGSFNYTVAAASDRHAENACVFRHAPEMATEYTEHWKDIWNESDRVD
jgi:phosphatidylserine/phosphatidylglycerophosphate/cardiolipin synthase-like enzyme